MVTLSFLLGLIPGLILISPTEWLVHKYLLHVPQEKRRWFNRAPSFAHNDVHHRAFRGPAHYYRDIVNQHVLVHFHWAHVLLIFGIAFAVGLAVNRLYTMLFSVDWGFGLVDGAYVFGVFLAGVIAYVGYEVSHHYMHIIGERRLTINRVLGDLIQGGKANRDGKLRFPKPFLDACCNAIEKTVDRHVRKQKLRAFYLDPSIAKKFDNYISYNTHILKARLSTISVESVYTSAMYTMIKWEIKKRNSLGTFRRLMYWIDRRIQWFFRGSPVLIGGYFRHIDNNHFRHHYENDVNLNVFLTWADKVFRTRRDSSPEELERRREYWLCPNSPDTDKFPLGK